MKNNKLAPRRKATPKSVEVTDFSNVMVDLETLGRRPGCAILSIGAVEFGPEGLGRELYVVVQRSSQAQHGLHEDPDTLAWWLAQSQQARQVLADAEGPTALPLVAALGELTEFLKPCGLRRVKVWGNGSDFDNAILSACYGSMQPSCQVPWEFWHNRCYRTLKALRPGPKLQREGTYHNALDDAKSQALHAIELLR